MQKWCLKITVGLEISHHLHHVTVPRTMCVPMLTETNLLCCHIISGEWWDMQVCADIPLVYLPMCAHKEVRGQCWASPSNSSLCLLVNLKLTSWLGWFQPALGICLSPHIHPSSSRVIRTHTQIFCKSSTHIQMFSSFAWLLRSQTRVLTIGLYPLSHCPGSISVQYMLMTTRLSHSNLPVPVGTILWLLVVILECAPV